MEIFDTGGIFRRTFIIRRRRMLTAAAIGTFVCVPLAFPAQAAARERGARGSVVISQIDPEVQRMLDEAKKRQADMGRAFAGQEGAAEKPEQIALDADNMPSIVIGSVLDEGIGFRSDGRFSLSNFRIDNLPEKSGAETVRYDLHGQERLHVRLNGPGGTVLADHYYTAVRNRDYGGWTASLSIGSPRNVNPDFVRHKAVLAPGDHRLTFFLDDHELGVVAFSVVERNFDEGSALQLEGPWRDLVAVSALPSLAYSEPGHSSTNAGTMATTLFAINDRPSGPERQGQSYFLKVFRDGEPFAAANASKNGVNESRHWEATRLDWKLVGDAYIDGNQVRALSSPTWGMGDVAPYAINETRSVFVNKTVGERMRYKTTIAPNELPDGLYRLELVNLGTNAVRTYEFRYRDGAFDEAPTVRALPAQERRFFGGGRRVLWLAPAK